MKKFTALIVITFALLSTPVVCAANDKDWITDPIYTSEAADDRLHSCFMSEEVEVEWVYNGQLYLQSTTPCIIHGKDYDFLYGRDAGPGLNSIYAVANHHGGDNRYKYLAPHGGRSFFSSISGDALMELDTRATDGTSTLRVYRNLSDVVIPSLTVGGVTMEYEISNITPYNYTLAGSITYPTMSQNGRYIAAVRHKDDLDTIMIIDTQTGSTRDIKLDGYVGPTRAVTSDGRYIVAEGVLYDTTTCRTTDGYLVGCAERVLPKADILYFSLPNYLSIDSLRFSEDDNSLFGTMSLGAPNITKRLQRAEFSLTPRLEYLALGDSYTSGEGDVGRTAQGGAYYINGTGGSGGCHLSSRSYPYLLREKWGIAENAMKSVACSGAKVLPDMYGQPNGYPGQHGELAGKSENQKADMQAQALEQFTPGIDQQVEFVRKYRPKVVTLTGGGNDVGFADMLGYCAYGSADTHGLPWNIIKEGVFGLVTCQYAIPNSFVQKITLKAIDEQYDYTVELLKRIKEVSPETRVYVVGYPSFVSGVNPVCGNGLELDQIERLTLEYFRLLLNQRLWQATVDQKVAYIDTNDSLRGGRICEGSKYMTGILNVNTSDPVQMRGLFHPNANGHAKLADTIDEAVKRSIPIESKQIERLASVGDAYDGTVLSAQLVSTANIPAGSSFKVHVDRGVLQPGSHASIRLYSDPIDLGQVLVAADGSVDTSIDTSFLPTGFHVLAVEGVGLSGEKTALYQSMTIGAEQSEDLLTAKHADGNGVVPVVAKSAEVSLGTTSSVAVQEPLSNKSVLAAELHQPKSHETPQSVTPPSIVKVGATSLLLLAATIGGILVYRKLRSK